MGYLVVTLVPGDFPQRLAARGLTVNVVGGWESAGAGSADHRAIALHHTASSSGESPSSCANYAFSNKHYNVLVDRFGVVWLGMRNKSNNAGEISGVALDEAHSGRAGSQSAIQRGLSDTTSSNSTLFAISAQNNGTGEHWSDALCSSMAIVAAVTLECFGRDHAGFVTQHRVLTSRKIDNCGDSCPYDWQALVNEALRGDAPAPEVEEMWSQSGVCPAGTDREHAGGYSIGLPYGRKSSRVDLYCDTDPSEGVSLWACVNLDGKNHGLWGGGNQWELWVPGRKLIAAEVSTSVRGLQFAHMGGTRAPLLVTVSGT